MRREREADASNRLIQLLLVLAGGALSTFVAMTDPFTIAADMLTALALAAMLTIFSVREIRSAKGRLAWQGDVDRVNCDSGTGTRRRWGWLWAFALCIVVAFELVNLFLMPRPDHPTISSMLDGLESVRWMKGVTFFAWLALGLFITGR